MNANPGDQVKITTKDTSYEGVVMPNESKTSIFLKLKTGYNVGINLKKITELKVIKKAAKNETKAAKPVKPNKDFKTIAVLHTGGTIASKVDYQSGGVTAKFNVEDLLALVPELQTIANINTKQVANIMSENMRFSFYKKIAQEVKAQVEAGVDGIIIGHGTDTLQSTAAVLSFMFENLPIPVILVGSQRSTDRGSTDGPQNLICAARFIAKTDFAGVAISMHDDSNDEYGAILPATKTKKFHTSRRDAFKPVNDTIIAKVHVKRGTIQYIKKDYPKKSKEKLVLRDKLEEKIGILRATPNLFPEVIDFYREKKYKGLIIEGTGLGHMPLYVNEGKNEILKAVEKLIKSGCVVAMTSQCIFGRVMMDVYTNMRLLKEVGVIEGKDMLTETAFIKLAWLLGNYKDQKEIKELFQTNLVGEINERIPIDNYL